MNTLESRVDAAIDIVETQWSLTEDDKDEIKFLLVTLKELLQKKSSNKKSGK